MPRSCRRRRIHLYAPSVVLSFACTEGREHLLSLFIPTSGRRARWRKREGGGIAETEHKEKQAAAIRLQQEAGGEERTRLQYRLYIFATKRLLRT